MNFWRTYTDILTRNVYVRKDFTYSNLKNINKNDKLVVLSRNKDSSVIIMQGKDYDMKLQNMKDNGIKRGIYS